MRTVSRTSQWTAAARSIESELNDRLFEDKLARHLSEPEGFDLLKRYGGGGLVEFVAIRTHYLDSLIGRAAEEGLRQVVLLASGMDTRAFRLSLPDDVVIFEVDHAALHDEKAVRLEKLGSHPLVERRVVRADLREDWIPVLAGAGWRADLPTLWIPEALLFFLDEGQTRTFLELLSANSAPGSVLGVDVLSKTLLSSPATKPFLSLLEKDGIPWRFGTDQPAEFLLECGWQVTELREPGEDGVGERRWPYRLQPRDKPGIARNWLITAQRAV